MFGGKEGGGREGGRAGRARASETMCVRPGRTRREGEKLARAEGAGREGRWGEGEGEEGGGGGGGVVEEEAGGEGGEGGGVGQELQHLHGLREGGREGGRAGG